jgi:hypothetical protein
MAGTGLTPAAKEAHHGVGDPVEDGIRERWSRRRLLQLLLAATLITAIVGTIATVVETLGGGSALPVWHIAADLGFMILLAFLAIANRRGHTMLASWVFCGALVLNGSEFFALPELDRTLTLYAAPIMVAAFLIRPVAALEVLVLSIVDYLIAYFRHAAEYSFNWISLLVLCAFALAAWLAARRAAWFEESAEMYRLELDRVVADFDRVEANMAALRVQFEARQAGAAPHAGTTLTADTETAQMQTAGAWRLARSPETGTGD